MARSTVAVLFTKPSTVLEDYARLLELAGARDALDPSATTILKDNISWHYPMPSANTTPWQLEGTIAGLRGLGYSDLVCVENETVVTDPDKGDKLNLYAPVLEAYGVPVKFNFRPEHMTWKRFEPKARMRALANIYPEGIEIPDYFEGKNIVHLPTVKCHIYTTTTGAMKNAFGGLLYKHRHYTHTWIHEVLVDLLAIQKEIHPGLFAVMDGTTAGNGPGPRILIPTEKNVILASADQVAIDAVAAKLMGFDPMTLPYLRMAHEDGLGIADPREIEVVGDSIEYQDWHFEVGYSMHKLLAWFSWYGPTKVLQDLLFKTKLVEIPTLVSAVEHDLLHWPLKERFVFERWKRETQWGHLFEKYEQVRTLAAPSPAPRPRRKAGGKKR
ncbi:MAG: DUF362 domain-containing protein [Myxococcales bacterium]